MGLYFRKSIGVGPLRFNLSQRGIGVSAGIPGFRIGTGPRGNYVHMGANGIYYRAALSSPLARPSQTVWTPPQPKGPDPVIPAGTVGPTLEIESADVSQLVDSSSADLLNEMRRKKSRPRYLYAALVVAALVAWLAFAKLPGPWPLAMLLASIALCVYTHLQDLIAKTVVLFYDFDEDMARAFEGVQSAGKHLATARGFWHVQGHADVHDRRYHAGASNLSTLADARVSFASPTFLQTNVEVFSIPVGRQTLYFFPDRLLVADGDAIGAIGYKELSIQIIPTHFIEERPVPTDTHVVDHTWRYLNKNGTPDRRFRDNRQLPVCEYSKLHLTSPSGLNEMVMVSRPELAQYFHDHLAYIRSRIPQEGIAKVADRNFV